MCGLEAHERADQCGDLWHCDKLHQVHPRGVYSVILLLLVVVLLVRLRVRLVFMRPCVRVFDCV